MNWDWLISGTILIWLGLTVAAKMTHQKIPELLSGIKDFIQGTTSEASERGEELLYYD